MMTDYWSTILTGHSAVILGQAGTGKSTLVQRLLDYLPRESTSLTCMTGTACKVYKDARTLHSWFSMSAHEEPYTQVKRLMSSSPDLERIIKTKCLIIDEASMLSAKLLDRLHIVLSSVLKNGLPFGGMQVILVGDFLQLGPVPNSQLKDPGHFPFKACIWPVAFDRHIFVLEKVHRQSDPEFAQVINKVAQGIADDHTVNYLSNIANKPQAALSLAPSTTVLFATNKECEEYNMECLLKKKGHIHKYYSTDKGHGGHVLAEKILCLKVGSPVILLRNISHSLTNGTVGTVFKLEDDGPTVKFPTGITKLTRLNFTSESFSRLQFPLRLGYGITIHKAQGMTIQNIVIDCKHIDKSGQLGVALGRCTKASGVTLINFHKATIVPQPEAVTNFYKNICDCTIAADFTCCKGETQLEPLMVLQENTAHVPIRNDWLDEIEAPSTGSRVEPMRLVPNGNILQCHVLLEDAPFAEFLSTSLYSSPSTQFQYTANDIVKSINISDLKVFVNQLLHIFEDIKKNIPNFDKQCDITYFYTRCNSLLQTSFQGLLTYIYGECQLTKEHHHVAFRLFGKVRQHFIYQMSNEAVQTQESTPIRVNVNDDTQRAKLRYVAAYSVAKTLHHTSLHIQQVNKSTLSRTRQQLGSLSEQRNILLCFKIPQVIILEATSDIQSLAEIEFKQNLRNSLTHITDSFFHFSEELVNHTVSMLTFSNLEKHKGEIYHFITSSLTEMPHLFQSFISSITEYENYTHSNLTLIFRKIVTLFSKVLTNQLRKDYLESVGLKKEIALRKETSASKRKSPKELQAGPPVRKSKRKVVVRCPECQQPEGKTDEEWIECERCKKWLHRWCVGLFDESDWKQYTDGNKEFYCSTCLPELD